jgi:hypothetical protein
VIARAAARTSVKAGARHGLVRREQGKHSAITPDMPHAEHSDWLAVIGILLTTWLAFGRVAFELGHQGDSWAYMAWIEQYGPFSILTVQPGRLLLPMAWAVGFAVAQANPWTYHVIADVFLGGAAIGLYTSLRLLVPQSTLLAFLASALSLVWPSDPTRYDIATLGNRQALFFYWVGVALYVLAWRRHSTRWLVASSGMLTISLLTYEAQVPLVLALVLLPLLGARGRTKTWLRKFVIAGLAPCAVWAVVNVLTVMFVTRLSYQMALASNISPQTAPAELLVAERVLWVDALERPLQLLALNAVPDRGFVIGAVVLIVAFSIAVVCADRREAPLAIRTLFRLAVLGVICTALSLLVFAFTPISSAEPGRVQTFSMAWAAISLTCAGAAILQVMPLRPTAHRCMLAGCAVPLFILFISMAAVYQRNFRQTWAEQRNALHSLALQAPDLPNGSLVLIGSLPDTRIIFPSGYTCEFALAFIEGHAALPAGATLLETRAEGLTARRISCGLLFNGRDLDPQVDITFGAHSVVDHFPRFSYEFPFDRVIAFSYVADGSLELLDTLPDDWLPANAEADRYNPRALIDILPRRRDLPPWL